MEDRKRENLGFYSTWLPCVAALLIRAPACSTQPLSLGTCHRLLLQLSNVTSSELLHQPLTLSTPLQRAPFRNCSCINWQEPIIYFLLDPGWYTCKWNLLKRKQATSKRNFPCQPTSDHIGKTKPPSLTTLTSHTDYCILPLKCHLLLLHFLILVLIPCI